MTQSDLCLSKTTLAIFWRRQGQGARVDTVDHLRGFEITQERDDGSLDCIAGGEGRDN